MRLGGWVQRRRDLGGIVFIDLRDRAGIVQISAGPDWTSDEVLAIASRAGSECVVLAEGEVFERPGSMKNPDLETGDIEVRVDRLELVGPARAPDIPVARGKGEEEVSEEMRLKHRLLDLRRPEMIANLTLRHRLLQRTRQVLSDRGYLELETPVLTKPTPEGARDYVVPSRLHAGEFYALAQSPQIYKQLFMMSGYDRYFQIARCFRDEDLRADRQPEFTQIDIEAAFIAASDIHAVVEELLVGLWGEADHTVSAPFLRMTFREVMERFGSDKPDLRFPLEITDLSDAAEAWQLGFLSDAIRGGGRVRGLYVPGGVALSRKQIDQLTDDARLFGLGGLAWAKRQGDTLSGPLGKHLTIESAGLDDGAALFVAAGPDARTSPALDRVRLRVVELLDIAPTTAHAFLWVDEFPLFERDEASGAFVFAHHPFTAPHPADADRVDTDPGGCRSTHYDIVYNGVELGSGSIRITDPTLQRKIFERLGMTGEQIDRRFGFLLHALGAGAPPHGGIALGFDRVAMLLAGCESIRDVIAFPKTTAARALFEGAPTPLDDDDVRDLHIRVTS